MVFFLGASSAGFSSPSAAGSAAAFLVDLRVVFFLGASSAGFSSASAAGSGSSEMVTTALSSSQSIALLRRIETRMAGMRPSERNSALAASQSATPAFLNSSSMSSSVASKPMWRTRASRARDSRAMSLACICRSAMNACWVMPLAISQLSSVVRRAASWFMKFWPSSLKMVWV